MGEQISFTQFYKATEVPGNAVLICALGQAGFLVKGGGIVLLIDPYLTNSVEDENPDPPGLFNRSFCPPVQPGELAGIDYVFVTHHHRDHCDPGTLLPIVQQNPGCKIIAPPDSVQELLKFNIPDSSLHNLDSIKWQELDGVGFCAVPAAHPDVPQNLVEMPDYVGYLLTVNGIHLYHSGDTVSYGGLEEKIRSSLQSIDIACIVVNGRDETREKMGIVGNLNPGEALHLAKEIHAKLMIPMHNDLFLGNSTDPDELTQLRQRDYPDQNVLLLRAGDGFLYIK